MDDQFRKARLSKIADYDQSRAIILSHIQKAFFADPKKIVAEWNECYESKTPLDFTGVVDAAIHWFGILEVRKEVFRLIDENCYVTDEGDYQLNDDDEGDE